MGWIIERDHLHEQGMGDRSMANARYGDITGATVRFKLVDDDGITYYSGRVSDDDDTIEELFDWSQADSGTTEIYIRKGRGPWQSVIG